VGSWTQLNRNLLNLLLHCGLQDTRPAASRQEKLTPPLLGWDCFLPGRLGTGTVRFDRDSHVSGKWGGVIYSTTHFETRPFARLAGKLLRAILKVMGPILLASVGLHGARGASPRLWKPTSAPSACWFGLASSADGNKLVAVGEQGIYLSTNAGASWIAANAPSNQAGWWGVASSADGSRLAVTGGGFILEGPIYVSTNSGGAWSKAGVPDRVWTSVACSADGNVIFASATGANGDPKGGPIYISRDSGTTWGLSGAPVTNWASLACSADGNRLVAAVGSPFGVGGPIYTSSDAGHTWKLAGAPIEYWRSVASSGNGVRLVAATGCPDRGSVFISSDAGATWTPTSAPNRSWTMACSAGGATLVGVSSELEGGGALPCSVPARALICVSTNYGQVWTLSTITNDLLMNPAVVVSSADGAKLAFANDGSLIYASRVPPRASLACVPSGDQLVLSWTVPSTDLVLQQSSVLSGAAWTIVPVNPVLNCTNLRYEARIPLRQAAVFYRLAPP
jgi:hypothetical protein